jgi:uncharacterized membrane protein YkgB
MTPQTIGKLYDRLDSAITALMARSGISLLRISIGIVFLWFGALKLVPGLSPAEGMIREAIWFLPAGLFIPFLAVWEILIGVGLISGRFTRLTILLLLLQMPGTISPVLLAPERVFSVFPLGLTLEGQYIVKNLVLISAALVIGATARGGGLVDDPRVYAGSGAPAEGRA